MPHLLIIRMLQRRLFNSIDPGDRREETQMSKGLSSYQLMVCHERLQITLYADKLKPFDILSNGVYFRRTMWNSIWNKKWFSRMFVNVQVVVGLFVKFQQRSFTFYMKLWTSFIVDVNWYAIGMCSFLHSHVESQFMRCTFPSGAGARSHRKNICINVNYYFASSLPFFFSLKNSQHNKQ